MRDLRYRMELAIVWAFYHAMGSLPPALASAFGGWLGETIGMRIKRTRMADAQIATYLPEPDAAKRQKILRGMWNHLGRLVAEYPHLVKGSIDPFVTILGREHVHALMKTGKPTLFISGHIGNWELAPKAVGMCGLLLHLVYRPPNNPYIDRFIDRIRSAYAIGHYGKGSDGARGVIRAMKQNESIGMLIDQKDNEGALIPFLGHPAMTMLSAARLAIKYNVPIHMMRARRLQGIHYEASISLVVPEPAYIPAAGDEEARALALMEKLNGIISDWIRETPEQWFWLHRRWPKE